MATTAEAKQQLQFESLPRPSYSSDLVPKDYHIFFCLLKEALLCHGFISDEEVEKVVQSWIWEQMKNNSQRMKKLTERYKQSND